MMLIVIETTNEDDWWKEHTNIISGHVGKYHTFNENTFKIGLKKISKNGIIVPNVLQAFLQKEKPPFCMFSLCLCPCQEERKNRTDKKKQKKGEVLHQPSLGKRRYDE